MMWWMQGQLCLQDDIHDIWQDIHDKVLDYSSAPSHVWCEVACHNTYSPSYYLILDTCKFAV